MPRPGSARAIIRPFLASASRLLAAALIAVMLSGLAGSPAPAAESACRAEDLIASVSWQGAGQTLAGPITFYNKTATACTLQGRPQVQLVDASGAVLPVTQVNGPGATGSTQTAQVIVAPGQTATVFAVWQANYCGPKPTFPISLKVALPDTQGTLTAPVLGPPGQAPLGVTPPCNASGSPSNISVGPFEQVPAAPHDNRYFPQTGFRIDNDTVWDYFNRRGGVSTFGYPVSRTFLLQGFTVQFFQRRIVQLDPTGRARLLNVLDPGLMPYTSFNGSTFPSIDSTVVGSAPDPTDAAATLAFVKAHAPDTVNGKPVNFYQTFINTVSYPVVFPNGGDARLLPGFDLEMWGIPTSNPQVDPNNSNFIYLRFQRGIMHYDAACNCTQGILLADYLKAILTGEGLPADLDQEARSGPFYRQYDPTALGWVHDPSRLPGTDLTSAFTRE